MADDDAAIDAQMRAFLRSEQMADIASYAERGRRFQQIAANDLNERWAVAFRAFAVDGDRTQIQELDDLGSELTLRGLAWPEHLVEDVSAHISAQAAREGLSATATDVLWEKFSAFQAAAKKPQG